ncbi:hypothetical protein TRAPUB_6817 [Trametes pubescens]|uniref:Uncharacterized protein n=1 Tax=Trametes pubescens TaxID=154538 RepID=A0A1M2V561_TRAPU|nr:hypothetical protein TRAPUB_6817 [Trametes pubescens]
MNGNAATLPSRSSSSGTPVTPNHTAPGPPRKRLRTRRKEHLRTGELGGSPATLGPRGRQTCLVNGSQRSECWTQKTSKLNVQRNLKLTGPGHPGTGAVAPRAVELAFRANAVAFPAPRCSAFIGFIVQGRAALCAMGKEAAAAKGVPGLVMAQDTHRARLLLLELEAFGTDGVHTWKSKAE